MMQQSVFVFAAQLLGLSCAIVNNFLVAWMLGPEGKGLVYLLQLIAVTGQTLLSFGLGPAAVYFSKREKLYSQKQISLGMLLSSFVMGTVPFLATVSAWPWFGHMENGKLGYFYIVLGLATVPFMVSAWNASYLSLAQGSVLSFNLLRSAQGLWFLLSLVLVLRWYPHSMLGVALCWAASVVLLGAFAPIAVWPQSDASGSEKRGFLAAAFRFGWRSHVGAVAQFLQQRVDVLMVSYFCTLRDVGFYSLAIGIAELLWYIPQTIANVLLPHVAESSDEGATVLTASFCRAVLSINALVAALLALICAGTIPLILPAFRPSVLLLCLLLPGVTAGSISRLLSGDLNGRGRPLETFRPSAWALAFSVVAGVILIPKFGIVSAAIVASISNVLNTVLYIRSYSQITTVPLRDLLLLQHRDLSFLLDFCRGLLPGSSVN